ncbi:MAG: hypothetical protein ACOCV9_05335 [Marinilabiliaceae bacterium]
MKQRKVLLALLLTFSVLTVASGQTKKDTIAPKSIISFVPQYLIKHGMRIDYDTRIKEHHWLQLSPQFYLRENSTHSHNGYGQEPSGYEDEYDFNQLLGAGVHIYHRFYPTVSFEGHTAYIKYGLTWQYFNITYDEILFNNYVERYTQIHKSGADINFGVVTFINEFIGIDLYAGLGFRYSYRSSDADDPRKFNNFFDDYGYTGNILNLGLRLSLYKY